jgi:predicted Zn-dependent protease
MRYGLTILLMAWMAAACATTKLPPVTKNFVPEEDERRLWLRSEEEQRVLNRSGLIYKDEDVEAYVNGIARRLHPEETSDQIPFKIFVIKNPFLNAFAFPNGVIYVHTGILASMDNEAQLATLLAHEMTHVTHRHLVKMVRDMKNKTAFLATLQVVTSGLGPIGSLAGALGAIGTIAAVTGYSRENETEADVEGFRVMALAGYDVEEAPKLFLHLKREVEEEKIKEPFFFGTHPKLQERIDNYNLLLKSTARVGERGAKNSEIFLGKTAGLVLENAVLDLKAGRFNVARQSVEKYLTVRQNDARAVCLLGEIHRQQGEIEQAKENYRKAISLDPSYPDSHKGLGVIYFKENNKDRARDHLEQYLRLSPKALDRAHIEEYIARCREKE